MKTSSKGGGGRARENKCKGVQGRIRQWEGIESGDVEYFHGVDHQQFEVVLAQLVFDL